MLSRIVDCERKGAAGQGDKLFGREFGILVLEFLPEAFVCLFAIELAFWRKG